MNESNPDITAFVLPIVCVHCGKENNLSLNFALLAPDADVPKPLDDRDADDSDEEISDMPPNVTEEEA